MNPLRTVFSYAHPDFLAPQIRRPIFPKDLVQPLCNKWSDQQYPDQKSLLRRIAEHSRIAGIVYQADRLAEVNGKGPVFLQPCEDGYCLSMSMGGDLKLSEIGIRLARLLHGDVACYYPRRPRLYEVGVRIKGVTDDDREFYKNPEDQRPDHDPRVLQVLLGTEAEQGPLRLYNAAQFLLPGDVALDQVPVESYIQLHAEAVASFIFAVAPFYRPPLSTQLPNAEYVKIMTDIGISRGGGHEANRRAWAYKAEMENKNAERRKDAVLELIELWRQAGEHFGKAVTLAEFLDFLQIQRRPDDFRKAIESNIATQVLDYYPDLPEYIAAKIARAKFDDVFEGNEFAIMPPELGEVLLRKTDFFEIPSMDFSLKCLQVLDPELYVAFMAEYPARENHARRFNLSMRPQFPHIYPEWFFRGRDTEGNDKDQYGQRTERRGRPPLFYTGDRRDVIEELSRVGKALWHTEYKSSAFTNDYRAFRNSVAAWVEEVEAGNRRALENDRSGRQIALR